MPHITADWMEHGSKNADAWEKNEGTVYISESGGEFTRADFERYVAEFAKEHGLPTEGKAYALFDLCTWQHPCTLLDEDINDHAIWPDEEWPETPEQREARRDTDLASFGLKTLYTQAIAHMEREMARYGFVYTVAIQVQTNYGHTRCVESVEMHHSGNVDEAQYRCEQLSAMSQRMNEAARHLRKIAQAYPGNCYYIVTFDSVYTEQTGGTFNTDKFEWNTGTERPEKPFANFFQYERVAQFFWFLHERLDELAAERKPAHWR